MRMSELARKPSVNPQLSHDEAREILWDRWGVEGELSDLGSLQDQNLRVTRPDGTRFVLKITGATGSRDELEVQNHAMRHIAAQRLDIDSPVPVATVDGTEIAELGSTNIRLLTWVEGVPLAHRRHLDQRDLVGLGGLAARVALALVDVEHAALDREDPWDPRRARQVVGAVINQVQNRDHQSLITRAMHLFHEVEVVGEQLPVQPVHADLTDVNAVCRPGQEGHSLPTGVLDFGDVMRTWRVGDIAATAVAAAGHPSVSDPLDAAIAVLSGYHAANPLEELEIDAFWPLVLSRAAVCTALGICQAQLNPDSAYARIGTETDLRALHALLAVPASLAVATARAAVGLEPRPANRDLVNWLTTVQPAEVIKEMGVTMVTPVDLSVFAESFAYGEWTDPAALKEITSGSGISVGRWGECRLAGNGQPRRDPQPNLHLGADIFVPVGTAVHAPLAGCLAILSDDQLVLDLRPAGGEVFLRLAGLRPSNELSLGGYVDAGALLGTVAHGTTLPSHVHVQLSVSPDLPGLGSSNNRTAWLAVCPDPSPLLSVDVAADAPTSPEERKRDRETVVARPQHLYYEQPVEIVRGWRHYLYDATGRPYLDMINNIASVGHSHPKITEAATRQLRRLNTNSRFLYDSMSRYSARIADLLPPELNSVFLVNSGSEAADLALQLAQVYTGRRDIVALAGAYHGWTGAVIDVCTSPMDRPNWREDLQPHIHIAEQPDPYRGRFGNDSESYSDSVRAACAAARPGGGVAAFITEPLLGNQGAVEPPEGFLRSAYAAVRAAGGLCIADEVQVGLGRTGEHFWAFEHEGVVPDIVVMAKATGNGHPLGVVVCRSEIADAFDGRTAYFSSTGGGPVSCEIGLAVLDVIRDEGLQENARLVGGVLKSALLDLAEKHSLIGAVHGRGLYQGVDLVKDRTTKEPAREEALAISERLRSLGVIMQPTGDSFNVLKIKPPLCLDIPAADYFISTIDQVLGELA